MVHIGQEIKRVIKERKMKVVEFARNINTDRNNVYDIYQRSSIDTELLVRISETLKYDFFHLYSHNALQKKFGHDYRDAYTAYGNEANHDLLYLEERIKNLEKRLDDKEEIIRLLKQGKP